MPLALRLSFLTLASILLFAANEPLSASPLPPPAGGVISGVIEDSTTKETLVGATISVKGTRLGTYTNKGGYFSLSNVPAGDRIIVVSSIGYLRKEIPIKVVEGGSQKLRVEMVQASIDAQEVAVIADREEDKRQINISQVNIPMQQIQSMRIGGESDIFRALQMLPGVLTSSQISSGLYIRGGSPDQNLVLLDGMTVYNPTHLFGFISAFNSDAVKDVDLIKGGFPAEFGGRMSAVLNITQKDGNRDRVEGLIGLGLISSRASIQGPLGSGSWFIGARRTYLDLVLGLIPDDPASPFPNFNFYDINAKITQNLSDDDKISLSGFFTNDALSLEQPGLLFNIGIGNRAGALRWSHIYGDDLFSVVTVSGSRYQNGFDGNNSGFEFSIANSIFDYSLKSEFEWFASDAITVKTGYEGTLYNFTYEQNFSGTNEPNASQADAVFKLDIWDNIHAVFGQFNWQVTDLLSMQAGIRGNYWSLSSTTTVDPRMALRYQLFDGVAIKAAWGIYHQYLRLAAAPDFSFFDTWLPTDMTVPAGRSDHYIFAVETKPFDNITLNVDLYYKVLRNINELRSGATRTRNVDEVFFVGNGEAYGAEIFLQKSSGRLTGWIGYALGWVNARFDSVNRGNEFRPKYDRRHDFKVTALYALSERWDLGASFIFQTGQSYTGATSQLNGSMPDWDNGIIVTIPSQRWGLRLPASHQLNLNVNYKTTLFELPFMIMLDVYNVYSRRDIWFRFYDTSKEVPTVTDVRLLPILPTISFELKF